MSDKDIKIAIIGGGIAGFSSGLSLIQNGFKNVTVFERDETASQRRQGYGLTILQGISALKKLDTYQDVYNIDTPSRSHFIFDYEGNLIGFFGTIFWPSSSDTIVPKNNKKHNLHLSRQDLRNILLKKYYSIHSDKENAIKWNKKLVNISGLDTQSEYELEFNDGLKFKANLIIGCDGINSVTRKYKYPINDLPLNYLGILLVLGISKTQHPLGNQRVFQTVDGNTRLFAMPFSHDPSKNIMWQLSFPLDETTARYYAQDTQALKTFLLEKCGNWHQPIPDMIEATSLEYLMGIPAFDRDLMPAVNDNKLVVLLGDAAHPMSPFKGQGANQALLDACELTECLNKFNDLPQAIYEFELKMNKRVLSKVMASRERVSTYHQANILNSDNFFHRGVNESLLESLRKKGVNAQTQSIEDVIINEMKQLNLLNENNSNNNSCLIQSC